ncbi:NAD(P)H dehydrogenase (quinone) [Sphingomonas kyeonggiensis]|uniref:NAD(P)H dehydrogenase (Quinone) n=1 Tax=Sphingomonas kyeonggiensis TaxID=1268553 RepID=A0A7W7K3C1_9SPHN|nr:SDR family oxidoreductase [Sphingomonas kyeonggiensis]MBB4839575.1 NAD(P)H dehydrogenase (quinone) [Sphingomonas kyeonggiensis]
MTIAITGATGQLGRLTVEKLKPKLPAEQIVALVRSPEKAADLGVPARAFDYDQPQTLAAALAGIDTLLLISSSEIGKREAQHAAVIEAARQAGVGRIVYTSLLHADTSTLGLAGEHLFTEKAIAASGLPYTFLRNGWYTENYAAGVQGAVAHGALIGASGEGRIAAASRADYADAAVAVLTGTGHDNATYELAGDTAFTLADLAAEISRQTGRDIPFHNLAPAEYGAALLGAGVPAHFAELLAAMDVEIAKDVLFDDSHTLSKLTGHPTISLADAVKALIG